jgi:hypothetical protein
LEGCCATGEETIDYSKNNNTTKVLACDPLDEDRVSDACFKNVLEKKERGFPALANILGNEGSVKEPVITYDKVQDGRTNRAHSVSIHQSYFIRNKAWHDTTHDAASIEDSKGRKSKFCTLLRDDIL